LTSVISFQRFLVPVYYWKTVEIMITDVNYYEIGSTANAHVVCNIYHEIMFHGEQIGLERGVVVHTQ
jgi:hypothetical protein